MGPPASYRVSRVRYYSGATWLVSDFVYGSFTLFAWLFQNHSTISLNTFWWSATPKNKSFGLASFPFARRYLGNRCFFLLLELLRCFSSAGSLYIPMDSVCTSRGCSREGCPIRISADLGLFAAPRSFSQLVTSFFGFRCQGILLALFLA